MDEIRTLWNRFEKSGKLEDYLEFCRQRRKKAEADGEPCKKDQSSL